MKRIKNWWMALLLGALLMATVVGAVWARPKASPVEQYTTYKLTIPAGHFHPRRDGYDWYNGGYFINLDSGSGYFTAALPIALPGRFTVEKMTLFANDANLSFNICARLYRVNPWTQDQAEMGIVCTDGSSGVQQPSTTSFNPDTIYGGHGGYVRLGFGGNVDLEVYAVQIEYH